MLVIKDFATTILASALTAAATSVVVSDASRLPALSAGDYYYLVLQKFTDRTSVEVVKVTGAAGNTLTVVRAQAGTTAKSFAIGDYAEQRITVGTFSEYIAQSVATKVDEIGGHVEQSLGLLNTGDLVKASVGISYDATNGHGTILSGGEGANKVTPYVALRPLGVADSSVQLKYAQDGSLVLSGGSRYVETGLLSMKHPEDANGWPNAINADGNNYNNRARGKVHVNNNALYFIADGTFNARRFGIQSGHADPGYATAHGILDLNPFGGVVRVNGGIVYHTNYAPTPAAVGALALVGGVLTGPLAISPAVGINPLDLASTPNPAGTSAQGVAGWDSTGGTREWGVGRYAANGVAEYAYFGFGVAPWNSGLRVYGAGDLRAGAVNRLYHEGYLPTPDTLGAVPQARTINSKPLTANITLSAADVGAVNKTGDTMTGVLAVAANAQIGASANGAFGSSSITGLLNSFIEVVTPNSAEGSSAGGIVFHNRGTSTSALYYKNDNSGVGYFNFKSDDYTYDVRVNGNKVYHQGFKPTAAEVGALPSGGTAVAATKLVTARQINGTNFDGSGNITTANWGTARTLTIGNAAKSVNGAGNVSWSLSEIGALSSSSYKPRADSLNNSAGQVGAVEAGDMDTRPAGDFALFNGNTVNNSPHNTYFYCETKSIYNSGALLQTAWPYDGVGGVYYRNFSLNTLSWTPWQRVYDTSNKPTPTDIGLSVLSQNTNGLRISLNGKYLDIGARNTSWTHFLTDATSGVYFYNNIAAADVQITSDERLKFAFQPIVGALDKVRSLSGLVYTKKAVDGGATKREAGLIAQAVQRVLPEAVGVGADDFLTLSPSGVIALLVEAIKELEAKLDDCTR